MLRILVGFGVTLLAVSAFALAGQQDIVASGEVVAISVKDGTLKMKEIAEPPKDSAPGTMQSGVVRDFVVNVDTKLLAQGRSIQLADIRSGDRVTIEYVLDSGKNVAKSVTITVPATD